jgi:hypothetical protein
LSPSFLSSISQRQVAAFSTFQLPQSFSSFLQLLSFTIITLTNPIINFAFSITITLPLKHYLLDALAD